MFLIQLDNLLKIKALLYYVYIKLIKKNNKKN